MLILMSKNPEEAGRDEFLRAQSILEAKNPVTAGHTIFRAGHKVFRGGHSFLAVGYTLFQVGYTGIDTILSMGTKPFWA